MALTKRYVRADADGTGDGTTDANSGATGSFTWAQMIADLNTPRAGYKYLVKTGTYANGTTATTLTGDGTTTSPNVIEGYNTDEGDLLDNGRNSDGTLNTTNFPDISYTGTTARFSANTANFLVMRCLKITAAANTATVHVGDNSLVEQCDIQSTGTNAASYPVALNARSALVNCDVLTTASTVTAGVFLGTQANSMVIGCRVKCTSGAAVSAGQSAIISGNTIYECTEAISLTGSTTNLAMVIIGNTIVNCTDDGIDVASTYVSTVRIYGNIITGNGANAINYNGAVCPKTLGYNRTRDNSGGKLSATDDWTEGTDSNNITSAATDANEYTSTAGDDYTLLSTTVVAVNAGVGFKQNIGAHGPSVFPSGGGGGGPLIGGRLVR